jgi:hypothetical protein
LREEEEEGKGEKERGEGGGRARQDNEGATAARLVARSPCRRAPPTPAPLAQCPSLPPPTPHQDPYTACPWVSGPRPTAALPGSRFCALGLPADDDWDIPDALPATYNSWLAPFCTDVPPPGEIAGSRKGRGRGLGPATVGCKSAGAVGSCARKNSKRRASLRAR